MALVVEEKNDDLVRPHLLAQSAPTVAAAVSEKRQKGVEHAKELRLSEDECDAVKDVGFKHLLLSHYRNQLLHWFVPEAILALSLSHSGDNDTDTGEFVLLSSQPLSLSLSHAPLLHLFLMMHNIQFCRNSRLFMSLYHVNWYFP